MPPHAPPALPHLPAVAPHSSDPPRPTRRQVTDTTTFTDDKRRAEVDSWLYDTCTRTLQHIVDIVVQYYAAVSGAGRGGGDTVAQVPPVLESWLCMQRALSPPSAPTCLPPPRPLPAASSSALLGRILELLLGFVRRTHQELAGVGVAALVRLIVQAGPHLDAPTWMMVRGGAARWGGWMGGRSGAAGRALVRGMLVRGTSMHMGAVRDRRAPFCSPGCLLLHPLCSPCSPQKDAGRAVCGGRRHDAKRQ